MKKLIFIISIIISSICSGQNERNGRITYIANLSINIDTSKVAEEYKTHKHYKLVKENVIKILSDTKPLEFVLKIRDDESLFYHEDQMEMEDIPSINLTKILADDGRVYTNRQTGEIIHERDVLGSVFLVNLDSITWIMSKEKKQIGDYQVYKAKTTKVFPTMEDSEKEVAIIAWYAPSIPLSFGPNQYHGLPGLILELKVGDLSFKATKIELNAKSTEKIIKPSKGTMISEKEFYEQTKKMAIDHRRSFDN